MDKNRLFVDFHVIQSVPPSCINRDDTGTPKTASYGGVIRARVSSQAWKHAMRKYFRSAEKAEPEELAIRTRYVRGKIANEIQQLRSEWNQDTCEKLAGTVLGMGAAKNKIKSKEKKQEESYNKEELDALFFISGQQIKNLAQLAAEYADEEGKLPEKVKSKLKNDASEVLKSTPGFEMVLFGRMVATDPSLNFDAASQVAHSISTHEVRTEYDYFTAVDDLMSENNAGSGHLGTIEFNSSTLYRYATINVKELQEQKIGEIARVVRLFAEAFIYSMPTGRQNAFANRTVPEAVYITIREDQPVNFCGAFEEAIEGRNGYSKSSVLRLVEYANKSYQNFVEAPKYAMGTGEGLEKLCVSQPMKNNLDLLESYVRELLHDTEAEK